MLSSLVIHGRHCIQKVSSKKINWTILVRLKKEQNQNQQPSINYRSNNPDEEKALPINHSVFTSEQQTEMYQDLDWKKHTVKEQIWSEQKEKITEFPRRGKSYGLKLMVAIELNIQCLRVMFLLNIKFWKQQRLTTWKSLFKFIETSDESFSIKHSFKKLPQRNADQ